MKKRTSRVLKTIGVLVLLPALLLALVQTPPGKTALAATLSGVLSRSENMKIRIGEISGWIPAEVTISEIEIGDAQGVWLTARKLNFRWMIREVLDGRIRFRSLSADELELHRFPRSGKKDKVKSNDSSEFKPLEIRMDGMKVKRLKLGKGVAGLPLEYAIHSGGLAFLTSGRLTGELTVSGDAEGRVDLDALLVGHFEDRLTIRAELKHMQKPTFGLDHLSGTGEVVITTKGVEGAITAGLRKGKQEGRISTGLHYSDGRLQLRNLQFNGPDSSASGDLTLGFSKGLIDASFDSAFIDATTNRYDLCGELSVATSNKTWAVDVQSVDIRGWEAVSFTLTGLVNPEKVELVGKLEEFDISQFPRFGMSNFTGKVNGQLSVSGSLQEPLVIAGIEVDRFSSTKDTLDELPELAFQIVGGVVDGRLFASTSLTNYSSGFLSAGFAMPCALSIAPFKYKPEPSQFYGELDADLDVGIFNNLAILENQFVAGTVKMALRVENQIPSGYLKFENGRYEHYDWGIVFRDCNAELVATRKGFEFKHAEASDGHDGKIKLSGGFGGKALDIHLALEGAKILQRPEIEAQISGQLSLSGKPSHPDVKGTLVIDRAEILLDNMVSAKPPVLTDFDAHAETNQTVSSTVRKPMPFGMDLRVEMPDQVYVNASLIDSVWGGELHVRDVPEGLSVSGKVEPRRGYVNFIGKKFRFQDGDIMLDGSVPPLAVFNNLTAEYSRSEITAHLVLNGRVNNPQYRLESTPAMPEDEILSQVLFNRDTSSISPYQAYQIAAAAQQLSGGVNGPGFMYQLRQAVGIDTLEWREADVSGGTSTVAAGKYITPDLYVEVSSSFDSKAETGMMAEYEVTRHFSIETSTGPQMRPGIGVNWKNDY